MGQPSPIPARTPEQNKSLVRDYYQSFHIEGRHDVISSYFSGDRCVRHEPGVADGVREFLHDLEALARDRTIDKVKLLLGQGGLRLPRRPGDASRRALPLRRPVPS
jgi:hypothetical protein